MLFFQSLLFHEVWICLQHGNILLNPLCQRLDRNYGISLFKNNMVWVIAFTLSAYWLREILSMYFCYQLVTPATKKLILVSCLYHAFKIVNVNIDAWRKWSPKMGILRLLLDYFHFDTVMNCIISLKRMFLQGFDTAVHGCIIVDIIEISPSTTIGLETLLPEVSANIVPHSQFIVSIAAAIWLFHAVIVQFTRKSTATLMVELYRKFAVFLGLIHKSECIAETEMPTVKESTNRHANSKNNVQTTLGVFLGPHMHSTHKSSSDCKVCRMLSKPEPSKINPSVSSPSVVFLGHGAQLTCVFDFYLARSELYWRASWWMENPLVHLVMLFISGVFYPIMVIVFGCSPVSVYDRSLDTRTAKVSSSDDTIDSPPANTSSHTMGYNFSSNIRDSSFISEVWMVRCFSWQYASGWSLWRNYAKNMVVRSVLQAEKQGINVIGLGIYLYISQITCIFIHYSCTKICICVYRNKSIYMYMYALMYIYVNIYILIFICRSLE